MNKFVIVLLALAILITVTTISALLAVYIVKRLRQNSDKPLSQDMTGVILVPVRRLKRSGFLSSSSNGISPRLEIAPDALRFKVFKRDHWPFSEIANVDAPWVPFTTRLTIKNRNGNRLYVDLSDRAKARDFLRSLPAHLSFKPRAIAIRDDLA